MPIINEGRLRFTFPGNWHIKKYDETDFYRNKIEPTGAELAAVDFIASPHPDFTTLILIEVKDFRDHAAENRKRQASGELVKEVIRKALHTLSGLYVAAHSQNQELNNFCSGDLLPPQNIELILFMEEDSELTLTKLKIENQRKRIADMELRLRKLKTHFNIRTRILNTTLLNPRDIWTAIHI